jgi:hypothetical protein
LAERRGDDGAAVRTQAVDVPRIEPWRPLPPRRHRAVFAQRFDRVPSRVDDEQGVVGIQRVVHVAQTVHTIGAPQSALVVDEHVAAGAGDASGRDDARQPSFARRKTLGRHPVDRDDRALVEHEQPAAAGTRRRDQQDRIVEVRRQPFAADAGSADGFC